MEPLVYNSWISNDWEMALLYHAFLNNGNVPYQYSRNNGGTMTEADYNNCVDWQDAAPQPTYAELEALMPNMLVPLIENDLIDPLLFIKHIVLHYETKLAEVYQRLNDLLE